VVGLTLATLYLVLAGGQIAQMQFGPTTCHLLADHYKTGGYFRVWDADAKREKWLSVDRAVCVEPVEVTAIPMEQAQ
jgi:hypothetical protein